jgi:hypothetical protein
VWPFFGQFVAHITADRSPVTHRADADGIRDSRVPRADLEGLFGSGPVGSPYLDAKHNPAKLLLSAQGSDVPRNHEGIALIGDPRNDVHLFISQMAVAFIKLHNRLVDRQREDETAEDELFEQARRPATWHPQHVILREFLRGRGSGRDQVNEHLGPCPVFPDLMGSGPVPLSAEQVGLAEHGWAAETPLCSYVLKEAEVLLGGDQLGPVGGRIVGEVLVGIIDADPESSGPSNRTGRRRCRRSAPAPSDWPTSCPHRADRPAPEPLRAVLPQVA